MSLPTELSWSAVAAGWEDMFFSLTAVRGLAEARILEAEGEALVPLSDLASLQGNEDRRDILMSLKRLASLDARPAFFAAREWQLFRLQWQLDHLEEEKDPEEPSLDVYFQTQALEWLWEGVGKPLDWPLLNPFIRSYVPLTDTSAGFALVIRDLQIWMEEQRKLLDVIERLLSSGHREEVAAIGTGFEMMQTKAHARVEQIEGELNIEQAVKGSSSSALWEKIDAFNAAVLRTRQNRGE